MNAEEQRAFEHRAPTTLPKERPSTLSWDGELLYAAELGDIPRMARALDQGATPKATDASGATVATRYAMGVTPFEEDTLRESFTPDNIEDAWAWMKASGIPLDRSDVHGNVVWDTLYSNDHPHMLTHAVEAQCAEVNLWALWKHVSFQERQRLLSDLDKLFYGDEKSHSTLPCPIVEGIPPFASTLMRTVMMFEGMTRSVYGEPVPPLQLQDRVLALSSLLSAKQGIPVENASEDAPDFMVLGLWSYAPASVLQDLARLPSYHHTLSSCLTPLVSTFHTITALGASGEKRKASALLVARRLARGVRTHLQHGFEFSQKDLNALMTLNEVRPLLEEHLLQHTLNTKDAPVGLPSPPRSRTRL